VSEADGSRRGRLDGLRLGVTTFTVVPVRPGIVDRSAARVAMTTAGLYGLAIGAVVGGLAIGVRATHAPTLLTAVLAVTVATLASRGLHLDGLADTVDGLGSYGDRDRALAIMRSPEIGPFGVVAVVIALLIPVAAIAGLLDRPSWAVLASVAAGYGAGRVAATWAARVGTPAARADGLGALVAATVPVPAAAGAWLVIGLVAVPAVPHRPWQGPVAVLAAWGVTGLLTAHLRRRIGGITGDTLGACIEIGTAVVLIGMAW
jgi:adenosylcobinamide-GDP ribazoletransferase